jgi:hypothetical protein
VVEGDPQEAPRRQIEAMSLPTGDNRDNTLEDVRSVTAIADQKFRESCGLFGRVTLSIFEWMGGMPPDPGPDEIRTAYLRQKATAHGIRILIALRRYESKSGRWPGSLDEIQPHVSTEILVDPVNKGNFAYRPTEGGFTLYSKGKNNVDEDGQYNSGSEEGPDDWPIWPPKDHGTRAGTANPE